VVDSANYGFGDFDYRYDHGPSMRAAYVLDPAGVTMDNALPGGQDGKMLTDHYGDDFMLWARNQTHPVDFDETSVVADAEACLVLGKP
jgi:acyl-homoserine lactone acylase PvdQ